MTSICRFLLDYLVLLRLNPYSGLFYFNENGLLINQKLSTWASLAAFCSFCSRFVCGRKAL